MTQTSDIDISGFPAGYFVIRSVGTNRLLDVTLDDIEDGTEIALWSEKEKSLVESFRDPKTNNQVFFIDSSGALCSRSAGHAIDVEDASRLVLRHRRPVSYPFPNAYAHPLPKFSYNPHTGEISVKFTCDPAYPPPPAPGETTSTAWQGKTYLLTSIPLRKPRTIIDNASEFIATNIFTPISYLTGGPAPTPARPDEVFNADIDLNEDELVEEERGEEAEVDDSPEPARKVRIVSVPSAEKNMMDLLLSEKTRNRRRWIITPLRTTNAKRS
ncbi:hypothetical protein CVT25_002950 [Psilocybe cyanescens]|uniref:Ricin B lectin domain-containing protein n=1 Tax=Psilocybe cyanescens TaxID=93625 RepID=A0A409WN15_PSICY|nr:hypothetical protein CVT25_002950 [Psilocybe cyanescens]